MEQHTKNSSKTPVPENHFCDLFIFLDGLLYGIASGEWVFPKDVVKTLKVFLNEKKTEYHFTTPDGNPGVATVHFHDHENGDY